MSLRPVPFPAPGSPCRRPPGGRPLAHRAARLGLLFALALAAAVRADEEPLTAVDLHGRITAAVRTAHEFSRDAQGAVNRGRPLPEAVLLARIRQLARDLARIKHQTVLVDGLHLRVDATWIESRLYGLHPDLPAAEIKAEAAALEQCLRVFAGELAQLERLGEETRNARLDQLTRARRSVLEILDRPDFARSRRDADGRASWAEQLAAVLERLFDVDIPGWASRGSEAILALVLIGGGAVLLGFLRRRRISPGARTDSAAETSIPAGPGQEDPDALDQRIRDALARGETRESVRLACRRMFARMTRAYGLGPATGSPRSRPGRFRPRPESLTHREMLSAWRAAPDLPKERIPGVEDLVDLHEEVCYAGRIPPDLRERIDRSLSGPPPGPVPGKE